MLHSLFASFTHPENAICSPTLTVSISSFSPLLRSLLLGPFAHRYRHSPCSVTSNPDFILLRHFVTLSLCHLLTSSSFTPGRYSCFCPITFSYLIFSSAKVSFRPPKAYSAAFSPRLAHPSRHLQGRLGEHFSAKKLIGCIGCIAPTPV